MFNIEGLINSGDSYSYRHIYKSHKVKTWSQLMDCKRRDWSIYLYYKIYNRRKTLPHIIAIITTRNSPISAISGNNYTEWA